jgi:ATP-dependent Clp protease protease subunit
MRDLLNKMLSVDTGQSESKIATDTDRDFVLSSDEALAYGIIDEILTSRDLNELNTSKDSVA